MLTLVSVVLIARLRPETSLVKMFDPADPSVTALERVVDRFPVAEELLVFAILPADAPADVGRLSGFAERLKTRLSQGDNPSLVAAVRDRAGPEFRQFVEREVVPNGLLYLDAAGRDEALRRLTPAGMAAQLERTRAALSAPGPAAGALGRTLAKDPLRLFELLQASLKDTNLPGVSADPNGDGLFLSPDGRGLLIRIDGTRPPGNLFFSARLVDAVTSATREANADGLDVRIAGAYAVAAYDTGRIQWDSITGSITSVLGLAAVVFLLYRRPLRLFAFAFTPVAVGIAWGFGVYALFNTHLTPLAAVIGGALGGIGIDYPIHFLAHYEAERRVRETAAEAARATLKRLGRPTFVAWLTSVVGFAAVAFSPVGVLRDFALIGSLGLLGVGVATVVVLPAALVAFDRGGRGRPTTPRLDLGRSAAALATRRPRPLLLTSLAVAAAVLIFVVVSGRSLTLELDLTAMHPAPNPPLAAQKAIQERMGLAGGTMFVHVEADSPAALVAKAHEVRRRLQTDAAKTAGVIGSFGLDTLLPDTAADVPRIDSDEVQTNLRAALQTAGFNPSAFASYLVFLAELVHPTHPPTVADLLRYPKVAALVLTRDALAGKPATESVTLVRFDADLLQRAPRERALDGLREALAGLPGVVATGAPALSHDLEAVVVRDLPLQFGVALVVILAIMAVHFRSVTDALLALSPTLLSAVGLLFTMEVLGLRLNLVNGVMVPLLLGINVDYGIFAVDAARAGASRGESLSAACTALVTCAATTCVGCGTLALTSVPAVASLGVLIVAGVGGCLVGTLAVTLPALLLRRQPSDQPRHDVA